MRQRNRTLRVLVIATVAAAGLSAVTAASASGSPAPTVLLRDNLASIDNTTQFENTTAPYPPYQHETNVEPSIGVNPNNVDNAVAAFHEGRDATGSAADIGFATTMDGGNTWTSGNLPHLTSIVDPNQTLNHASDPVVSFGPDNVVYVNSLVTTEQNGNPQVAGLAVSESKDGGLTWEAPVIMHDDNVFELATAGFYDDKNWMTVDMSHAAGHHFGRVYVVWDVQVSMLYAYCDPEGTALGAAGTPGCDQPGNWTTFANSNQGFYVFSTTPGIGSYPLVLQNGNLEIVFSGTSGFDQVTTLTPAGSVSWPAPLTFNTVLSSIASDDSGAVRLQRAGPDLPTASVDPVSGRVAVGWAGTNPRTDGLNDPEVAISTDATGQTFGSPIRVDQGAPMGDFVDRYNTMLDWGPTGDLRVGYRQRQEALNAADMSQFIDTFYQVSYDDGATFSAPLKVDTQQTDVGYCAFSRNGCFEGDYDQLAAAGANSYLVRDEAFASTPGEPYNNVPTGAANTPCFCSNNGHEHQSTWVAVVGPEAAAVTPEAPLTSLLALGGVAGVGGVVLWVRRRRARSAG